MLQSGSRSAPSPFKLRIVDATSLSGPGATTTDFRLHVIYDPAKGGPCNIHITSVTEGETFLHHSFEPDDLVVADRGYSRCLGIYHLLKQKANILIRLQPSGIRLLEKDETRIDWASKEALVPEVGSYDFWVRMPVAPPGAKNYWRTYNAVAWCDVRIIGARNNVGEVIWLLTNLGSTRLSNEQALEIYRQRWQIELFFKRLKSLADLNELPSRDPTTAIPWILLKLISAVLAMNLTSEVFSPWGYRTAQMEEPLEALQRRPLIAQTSPCRKCKARSTGPKKQTQISTTQTTLPVFALEA
jgi:hypothetical protein